MYYRGYGCGPGGSWDHRFNNRAAFNIAESDTEYTIKLFAPSLDKEQISLTTQNDILTIRHKGNDRSDDRPFMKREFRRERIEHSFDLKGKVDTENISARHLEGVLTIILPKSATARKPAQDVPIS